MNRCIVYIAAAIAVAPIRGQSTRVTFTADKSGTFPIVCATHHPTMVAELIVAAKR